MAYSLMQPSNHLNQWWLFINMINKGHLKVMSKLLFCVISLTIILLKSLPHISGATESILVYSVLCCLNELLIILSLCSRLFAADSYVRVENWFLVCHQIYPIKPGPCLPTRLCERQPLPCDDDCPVLWGNMADSEMVIGNVSWLISSVWSNTTYVKQLLYNHGKFHDIWSLISAKNLYLPLSYLGCLI